MSVLDKKLKVKMENGETWAIPVAVIARNRAEHYAEEYGGDVEKSLAEDTVPIFEAYDYEVEDWAQNNMNWSDLKEHAVLEKSRFDYQDGWLNSKVEITD